MKNINNYLPNTVDACHGIIRELVEVISALSARVRKIENENSELKELLRLNSMNSSLPPSRDIKKKKNKRPSSGLPSGGQPGHRGHFRELLDISQVDEIVDCQLPQQCECGSKIEPLPEQQRHQVYELPQIKLKITEYQLARGVCNNCRRIHTAELPEGISWGMTSPRLTGFMSLMIAQYHLSRRELQSFLREYFNFSINLGTVFNKQRIVNKILKEPVQNLLPIVKENNCVHMDETKHCRGTKNQWLWTVTSKTAAYFLITPSRGKKVVKELMSGFSNIVTSDRYSASIITLIPPNANYVGHI